MVVLKNTGFDLLEFGNVRIAIRARLPAETIQSSALALQGVNHIQSSHGLATSVLSVRHSVSNHILEKHLQHTTGLLINKT